MQLFTRKEIKDLIISVLVITIIFSYILGLRVYPELGFVGIIPFVVLIIIIAFVCHELAHKFVAQKFKCTAFYKMWPMGLFFSLILALLLKVVIIAPGAVVIYPFRFGRWGYRVIRLTISESGLIALAGPATNLAFALFFSFFSGWFFNLLVFINAWLAFFNLLPIPPLDGSKVLAWKIWVWAFMMAISFILIFPYLFG